MYLALLSEKEKEAFLGMAFHLVTIDGHYSDDEKSVINSYCQEMQFIFSETNMNQPIDILIDYIKSNSSSRTKKIFIFELIGLAMADNNYDEHERNLIDELALKFNINTDFADKCENMLNEYISFQTNLNQFILE